jgi:membrane-associated protein
MDASWAGHVDLAASWFDLFLSFVLHIDKHLFELAAQVGGWLYAILFLVVFCETGLVVTPFLPGDSLLFACGAVAGAGHLSYWRLIGVLLFAAVTGDAVNYKIGRHAGPAIFSRDTRFLNKKHLLRAHAFYERHGGKAIILARFIPIVRTFAPFVAGIALMNPVRFVLFNVTGAVIWVFSLITAGYFLGNIPVVRDHFSLVVYGIVLVSVMPVIVEAGRSVARGRKFR